MELTKTTNANGYIDTGYPTSGIFIISAFDKNGTGYAMIPVNVSGIWWIYVCGTDGGYTKPKTNTSITFYMFYY